MAQHRELVSAFWAASRDGEAGAVFVLGAQVRAAFLFTIRSGKITAIDLIKNPGRARREVRSAMTGLGPLQNYVRPSAST
jgi:hypothetical protein